MTETESVAERFAVGAVLPAASFPITRKDLVRYAGASGDFNDIHWNGRFAVEVGLPDVIAHGMYTMAVAGRVLTDWAGDPAAVQEYYVRFSRPVAVPDDGVGALVEVTGKVTKALDGGRVQVDLTVLSAGQKVLGKASAVVRVS
ncbi:MaoC family dehydratase [Actinospica acidithermotolerans]|uniref:MaoC family dehydratase n=1 Tax=Actinospica acidithermotolerans TaxID=2828514 RepID=UPI0027DB72B8|nr:MaoC family dehydratase [Actinospica acidithermotolerans]